MMLSVWKPRQVYAALSAMRNKTDKNDARGIAQVLRSGWYNKVHIKSNEAHYDRLLLTARKTVPKPRQTQSLG